MTKSSFHIEFSSSAREDLRWLHGQIEIRTNPDKANQTILGILDRIEILKSFPFIGPVEQSLEILDLGHRFLVKGFIKVIYRLEGEKVIVTDIFDSRQNPDNLLMKKL